MVENQFRNFDDGMENEEEVCDAPPTKRRKHVAIGLLNCCPDVLKIILKFAIEDDENYFFIVSRTCKTLSDFVRRTFSNPFKGLGMCELPRSRPDARLTFHLLNRPIKDHNFYVLHRPPVFGEADRKPLSNYDKMLWLAVTCKNRDLCCLAKLWGATDFDLMLIGAMKAGSFELCSLAKHWGARDFEMMMSIAAAEEITSYAHVARQWGASENAERLDSDLVRAITSDPHDVDEDSALDRVRLEFRRGGIDGRGIAMYNAALAGNLKVCKLLKKHNPNRIDPNNILANRMLMGAAHNGDIKLCKLAVKWGATDFNRMMLEAGAFPTIEIYQYAKQLGATNFELIQRGIEDYVQTTSNLPMLHDMRQIQEILGTVSRWITERDCERARVLEESRLLGFPG